MTSINTNIGAMVAQKNMLDNNKDLDQAMARISSGLRINSAADDAAGSAIATKMETQVKSLGVAIRNANDAISLTQTAEGALSEVENVLIRMRELSVQAGNSTLNASDRAQIQTEMNQLAAEIDSIASKTNFNDVKLLNGSNDVITMQTGIDANDSLDIKLENTSVAALNIGSSTSTTSNKEYTTGRIIQIVDMAANLIKLNGEDIFASALDVDATPVRGANDDQDGALTSLTDGQFVAIAVAEKINTNTGKHGVTATAFNSVTSTVSTYTSAAITINGTVINAANTQAEYMAAVNSQVSEVTVALNKDGFMEYTNDGGTLVFSGAAATQGIADDAYGGFVKLVSSKEGPLTIQSGSFNNGYSGGTATGADLIKLSMNEVTATSSGGVTYTANVEADTTLLDASIGLKINDVLIDKVAHQGSTHTSASDKAAAINQYTDETGVVAGGFTQALLTLDFNGSTKANHDEAKVQNIIVDLSSALSSEDVITAINAGMAGQNDIVASADGKGNVILTSASGADIYVDDVTGGDTIGQGTLFTHLSLMDTALASPSALTDGAGEINGKLTLTSLDGGSIKITEGIEDKSATGNTIDTNIGFNQTNPIDSGTSGVSVGTVEAASSSLAALDAAIDKISTFRANFGSYENRLDASINNMTTLKVNTEAARSRIEDADFAKETTNMTKAQILSQAATSMLAQANSSKQNLLALLQG